jgi:hypothetical protein
VKSISSITSHQITKKLVQYRSNISGSSTSSTSSYRLPRYLGNHRPFLVSQLGRSVSLDLPPLNAHYVPRRANSLHLPRIAELRRLPPSPHTLYISSMVKSFAMPERGPKVHRRHSSGRKPKVPAYIPSSTKRTHQLTQTSMIANISGSETGHTKYMKPFDNQKPRSQQRTQYVPPRSNATQDVAPKDDHGVLCRLRQKAARFAVVHFGWDKGQKYLRL